MSDMRTNDEIARKLRQQQLDELLAASEHPRTAQEIEDAQVAVIMTALADVRGVGTC